MDKWRGHRVVKGLPYIKVAPLLFHQCNYSTYTDFFPLCCSTSIAHGQRGCIKDDYKAGQRQLKHSYTAACRDLHGHPKKQPHAASCGTLTPWQPIGGDQVLARAFWKGRCHLQKTPVASSLQNQWRTLQGQHTSLSWHSWKTLHSKFLEILAL